MRQVPHLNELHARWFGKGLVVVGVTGEDAAAVEAWVKEHGVTYPIGIGNGSDYDFRGIPAAFLIDPRGRIVWRGHPASLAEETLQAALVGARPATVAAGLEEVDRLRSEGKLGGAHGKATELLAAGRLSDEAAAQAREIVAGLEQKVATALVDAAAAIAADDPYRAWSLLDPVAGACAGIPRADDAAARLQQLLTDARTRREIQAGQQFASAKALEDAKDFDGAHAGYKAMTPLSTTKAGKLAMAAYRAIEKDGKLGFKIDCLSCEKAGKACPKHRKRR